MDIIPEYDLDELQTEGSTKEGSSPPRSEGAEEAAAPEAVPPPAKTSSVKFSEQAGPDGDSTPRSESSSSVSFRSVSYSGAPTKVFEGWLIKKGEGMLAHEKRRFFCMHETGEVFYYTSHDLADCKGRFTLAGACFSDVALTDKTTLVVKTKGRSWRLTAPNEGQAKAWVKNMNSVIARLTGEPEPASAKLSRSGTVELGAASRSARSGKAN